MIRKMLLAFAGSIAAHAAVAAPPNFTISADKLVTILKSVPQHFTPLPATHGVTAIFDNLASLDPKGVYMAGSGYTLGGPQSVVGQAWAAAAFTPAANATVTEIDVAAGYILGTKRDVSIHIYADNGGVPGQDLWSHNARLPTEGSCCAVATVTDTTGLALTGGTQYWVGITTTKNAPDLFGIWNFNVADQVDPGLTASNLGSGWKANPSLPNLAFAVFGN